jgi:hypothetical protein
MGLFDRKKADDQQKQQPASTPAATGAFSQALARRQQGNSLQAIKGPERPDVAAIQGAVARREEMAKNNNKGICFVIDATGSREHSWREAQQMQARMFDALKEYKDLSIGVISYGGNRIDNLGWFNNADSAKRKMAEVRCEGGATQIVDSLEMASQGNKGKAPSSVILVGDAFEEDFGRLERTASLLKLRGVKVYAFVEGDIPEAATAFKMVADITGGVFKKFGEDLSLSDLVVAAAVYDTGGKEALQQLANKGDKGAKEMLQLTSGSASSQSRPKFGR